MIQPNDNVDFTSKDFEGPNSGSSFDERTNAVLRGIEALRLKLLDLTNRNKLLNFQFSARSSGYVRVVDELPSVLYSRLVENGDELTFDPLPDPPEEAEDERKEQFLIALESAIRIDEQYLKGLEALGDPEEDTVKAQRLERELRDRLRKDLGLPPRPTHESMTPQEFAKKYGIEPSYDLPFPSSNGEDHSRHGDKHIQTLLYPKDLERTLGRIYEGARTSLSETGINTLFFAFGFLEWYESTNSDKKMFSPLLLLPLEIRKKLERQSYRFMIKWNGEETDINLTLRERLRKDFAIELPSLEEEDNPEKYLSKVQNMVEALADKRWRVRRFVTLSLFSFGRLAMYHDLDPTRWPSTNPLQKHRILGDLLAGGTRGIQHPGEYNSDDPEIDARSPILILDADGSQFSAVVDVLRGQDLALKGPPGTGKSQTITNVIGAALCQHKRVLFVSEKMAALEVVKKRLDDAGLGPYCLELHSAKANKRSLLKALQERIDLSPKSKPSQHEGEMERHRKLRESLNLYGAALGKHVGQTGWTLYKVLWRGAKARAHAEYKGLPAGLKQVRFREATVWTSIDIDERISTLGRLEGLTREVEADFSPEGIHPWHFVQNHDLAVFQREQLVSCTRKWHDALHRLHDAAKSFMEIFPIVVRADRRMLREIPALAETFKAAPPNYNPPFLLNLMDETRSGVVKRWMAQLKAFKSTLSALRVLIDDPERADSRRLHELHKEASSILPNAHLLVSKVGQLTEKAQKYSRQAQTIDAYLQRAAEIHARMEIAGEMNIQFVRSVIKGIDLLRALPRPVLLARSRALCEEGLEIDLEHLKKLLSQLQEKKTELEQGFSVKLADNSEDLREHIKCIRSAGFFQRLLGGQYRKSVGFWKSIRKIPQKSNPHEIARELEDIADFLDQLGDFQADNNWKSKLGSHFSGLDTDVDGLIAVNAFGQQVFEQVQAPSPASQPVVNWLLTSSNEAAFSLLSNCSAEVSGQIGGFIETLFRAGCSEKVDLRLYAAELQRTGENIQLLEGNLKKLGIKDEVNLSQLDHLGKELLNLQNSLGQIVGNLEVQALLSDKYTGVGTDLEQLHLEVVFASSLQPLHQVLPLETLLSSQNFIQRLDELKRNALLLQIALDDELAAGKETIHLVMANRHTPEDDHELLRVSLIALPHLLGGALSNVESLTAWVNRLRAETEARSLGLNDLLGAFLESNVSLRETRVAFDRVLCDTLFEQLQQQNPRLRQWYGEWLGDLREQFRQSDKNVLRLNRELVVSEVSKKEPPLGNKQGKKGEWTQIHLLRNEVAKRGRHIPLRDLLKRSGEAIQCLKPCWLMSPASVAQYLDQTGVKFDLVVIDEASQMPPEEAIGAIARANQAVIVGDPQQLPPTSFFSRTLGTEGIEEDDQDTLQIESILDQSLQHLGTVRTLQWHYRSRHESLISFSNSHFYEDKLLVFPVRPSRNMDLGVELQSVDGLYKSRASVNIIEAQAVAEAVLQFIRKYPNRSLGVVAVNNSQSQFLQEEIDRLSVFHPEMEMYRNYWEQGLDPFFVKNLENVQGDERDVIFISTVYGREQEGGAVAQRFGPINSASGHRRLNVLLTRAREKVVLFTSLREEDILADKAANEGVRVLRDYIRYARTGLMRSGNASGKVPGSDFEVFVAEGLARAGYSTIPQYGVQGFFIDLAVQDPKDPESILMGIECDGASYHSSKSARDRDRLRQEILEEKGWRGRIHRIWSTDWFSDPASEMRKLIEHIEALRNRNDEIEDITTQDTFTGSSFEDEAGNKQSELRSEIGPESTGDKASLDDDGSLMAIHSEGLWSSVKRTDGTESGSGATLNHKDVLLAVLETEGPMPVRHAYEKFVDQLRFAVHTLPTHTDFYLMLQEECGSGRITKVDEWGNGRHLESIVRIASGPAVIVRFPTSRTLEEVPPSEVQVIAEKLRDGWGWGTDPHLRLISEGFGEPRMSSATRKYLEAVLNLDLPHAREAIARVLLDNTQ